MNKFFIWLEKQSGLQKTSSAEKINNEKFTQFRRLWQISADNKLPPAPDKDKAWAKLDDAIQNSDGNQVFIFPRRKWIPATVISVVTLLIISLLGIYFFSQPGTIIYKTSPGETLNVWLPDSSQVILNAASEISYSKGFGKKQRRLKLAGEAFFRVQKDSLAFIIDAGNATIRVVGTRFNVKTRNDAIEVGVKKGIVAFKKSIADRDSLVLLHKGQYSKCTSHSFPLAVKELSVIDFPDWLHKKLSCKQTPFEEVCRELERRFNTSIVIEDNNVKKIEISGMFEAPNLNTVLKTICLLVNKDYRHEKDTIIIY